jgi:hypothetical protein
MNSTTITRIGVLLGLTFAFQALGLPQPVTGIAVNCVLFLAAALFGPRTAAVVGLLTPFAALLLGQLPPPLWPFLPWIAAANLILVAVFHAFRSLLKPARPASDRLPGLFAALSAAIVKFAWLGLAVKVWMPLLFGRAFPRPLAVALVFPQLLTAAAGGILAVFLIRPMRRVLRLP